MTITLDNFIEKNWYGENRWRRAELNNLAQQLNLVLSPENSNKNVYNNIYTELFKLQLPKRFADIIESVYTIDNVVYFSTKSFDHTDHSIQISDCFIDIPPH